MIKKTMQKNLLLLFKALAIALLLLPSSLFAQKCQTSEKRQEAIAQNPSIVNEMNRINQFTKEWIEEKGTSLQLRTNATVTVPIVVHVLWLSVSEDISEAQINSQIDVLNADFRKLNANFSLTPSAFQSIAADVEIEFCLASIDPNGNPTNGITRTQTTIEEIGETNNFFSTAAGGHDPWDNTQYINIWICNQSDGSLGFATPPGTAEPPESDGLCIPSIYFGTVGTAANSQPNHLGRTATHEMGHYFNLEHIWGPGEGGCDEDDFVSDTPDQDIESEGCPTFPVTDLCTSAGNGINFNNYLDYSDDNCMTMFTVGQKMRMLAAVNGPRASLLNSNGCNGEIVGIDDFNDFDSFIDIFPNPAIEIITISIENKYTSKNSTWELSSITGEKQLVFSMLEKKELNVSHLPQGVYYLTCVDFPQIVRKVIITK